MVRVAASVIVEERSRGNLETELEVELLDGNDHCREKKRHNGIFITPYMSRKFGRLPASPFRRFQRLFTSSNATNGLSIYVLMSVIFLCVCVCVCVCMSVGG